MDLGACVSEERGDGESIAVNSHNAIFIINTFLLFFIHINVIHIFFILAPLESIYIIYIWSVIYIYIYSVFVCVCLSHVVLKQTLSLAKHGLVKMEKQGRKVWGKEKRGREGGRER